MEPDDESSGNATRSLQETAAELASGQLASARLLRVQVNGLSMQPTLLPGDTIIIDPRRRSDAQPGSVVTFLDQGSFLTHRIVEVTGRGLLAKGDGSAQSDEIRSLEQVMGQVIARERAGERALLLMNTAARLLARISRLEGRLYKASGSLRGDGTGNFVYRLSRLPLRLGIALLSGLTMEK